MFFLVEFFVSFSVSTTWNANSSHLCSSDSDSQRCESDKDDDEQQENGREKEAVMKTEQTVQPQHIQQAVHSSAQQDYFWLPRDLPISRKRLCDSATIVQEKRSRAKEDANKEDDDVQIIEDDDVQIIEPSDLPYERLFSDDELQEEFEAALVSRPDLRIFLGDGVNDEDVDETADVVVD
ncbi:hypothetical protein WR25_14480 [Diploscapter pachys]|uniref:ELM2 domain-containing protein n=1 Tax=Diploscapter pachys TaxID=2018661 RepID=A0A2A2LCG6_9BILA|nr:hypothetical protein WR25_14480 [Diploscapter pachys]